MGAELLDAQSLVHEEFNRRKQQPAGRRCSTEERQHVQPYSVSSPAQQERTALSEAQLEWPGDIRRRVPARENECST